MRRTPNLSNATDQRRGGVIIIAIIALILLAMATAALTATVNLQREVVRGDMLRSQAEWLIESALTRTASKLQKDAAFAGETWTVPPSDLGRQLSARVEISVGADAQDANRRVARMHLELTQNEVVRVRLTRTAAIDLK